MHVVFRYWDLKLSLYMILRQDCYLLYVLFDFELSCQNIIYLLDRTLRKGINNRKGLAGA
jgi:hypothetical protein